MPNDGTFVCDGITFPDRSPKPGMWEHRHLAAPVRVVSGAEEAQADHVTLENRGDFRDLAWLRATWAVEDDGVKVAGGDLPLPALAPGARADVTIPGFSVPEARGERYLTLRFTLAEETAWAPAGFEVGWAQVALGGAAGAEVDGSWTGDVPLDAGGSLVHPSFAAPPALALWRAPTDNDRIGGMADRWAGWGLASLARTLEGVERGAGEVVVRSTWRTPTGIEVPHVQRIAADGHGRIRVTETVEIPAILSDLPRVGTVLTLAQGHASVEWVGTGPHETYPDRRRGGQVGRWRSTVAEQLVPYLRPQENGGHADVRWLALGGPGTDGIALRLDRPRQVSVLHVTAADLDAATHDDEVRPRAETYVTIDAVHRGVGTASCGPDTLLQYIVPTGVHTWTWILEPAETTPR